MIHVPDLDAPLGGAADEHAGLEGVPHDCIDGGVVGGVALQIFGGELGSAQMDHSFFCSHKEEVLIIWFHC